MLKPTIFRERDICGVADSDLPDDGVQVLGRALASYLIRYSGRIICVGRDDRSSSPRLHAALLKGLHAAGTHVLDVGVVPSPVLYYSAIHFTADAAVMITGGNERGEYNGFRLVCGTRRLVGHALGDIYKVIQLADFEAGEGTLKQVDALTPYVEELASQFQFPRTVKFTLAAGEGTVRAVVQRLLKPLKAALVKKSEAAAGISISADAEHVAAFDERGDAIPPAALLLLFGREILTRKPESVLLYDEQFSEEVYKYLTELGGRPIAVSPSELSIEAKLKEEHAELSVQASGKVVFADRFYGFEDGIYAAFRFLELISGMEGALSSELARLTERLTLPR